MLAEIINLAWSMRSHYSHDKMKVRSDVLRTAAWSELNSRYNQEQIFLFPYITETDLMKDNQRNTKENINFTNIGNLHPNNRYVLNMNFLG